MDRGIRWSLLRYSTGNGALMAVSLTFVFILYVVFDSWRSIKESSCLLTEVMYFTVETTLNCSKSCSFCCVLVLSPRPVQYSTRHDRMARTQSATQAQYGTTLLQAVPIFGEEFWCAWRQLWCPIYCRCATLLWYCSIQYSVAPRKTASYVPFVPLNLRPRGMVWLKLS